MAIKKDQSALPTANPTVEKPGRNPDNQPRFMPQLARTWYQQYIDDGRVDLAMSHPTVLRGSDAGSCSRALSYKVMERILNRLLTFAGHDGQAKPSNPPSLADHWRMSLGSMVHEALQDTLVAAFPGAEVEVTGYFDTPASISFHADVWIPGKTSPPDATDVPPDEPSVLIEVKTINGFAFKMSATKFKGAPAGPRWNAVLQGAIAALSKKADQMVVGYLSMENVGKDLAWVVDEDELGRFSAEWTYTREEYEPLAHDELRRMSNVTDGVLLGIRSPRMVPDPEVPSGAVLVPERGTWEQLTVDGSRVDAGKTWYCNYCWHRDLCIEDGPDR